MKQFLVIFILVGGIVAAVVFYDPYLKPYLGPLVEKIAGPPLKTEPAPAPGETPKPAAPDRSAPASPAAPLAESPASPGPASAAPGQRPPAPPAVPQTEIDRIVEERYPYPQIIPLNEIVKNWTEVPQRAFPQQVEIQDRIAFILRGAGGQVIGSSVAVPGTLVKPVSLRGETLVVASMANVAVTSEIELGKTDFKKRVQQRYNEFALAMNTRVREQREKARQALLARPETLAAVSGGGAAFDSSGDPRFDPVKASLAAGTVKAFSLEEAVAFRWNGSQRINGDIHQGTFDTVTVKYEARTIFGTFPGEAKCLLQNGRVIGWVDPITEDEMI